MSLDLRTKAIVLRRTNYGESDRILNLLTPEGKISVLARGARKEKSRLAGSIELFSVSDVTIHRGNADLSILTGAKMLKFFSHIITDLTRLETASIFLKFINRAAEQTDNPEFFDILSQALSGLDRGYPTTLTIAWFDFNLARAIGEEINLLCDTAGQPLAPDRTYSWDALEQALRPDPFGPISAPEIKFARLLWGARLPVVVSVEHALDYLPKVTPLCPVLYK